MQTYQLFIEDGRYEVPTLRFVNGRDCESARRSAHRELADDPNHLGVDVYLNALWLFGVGTAIGGRPDRAWAD